MSDAVGPEREISHPSPHRERVSGVRLLLALTLAPLAWLAQLQASYFFSSEACFPSDYQRSGARSPGSGSSCSSSTLAAWPSARSAPPRLLRLVPHARGEERGQAHTARSGGGADAFRGAVGADHQLHLLHRDLRRGGGALHPRELRARNMVLTRLRRGAAAAFSFRQRPMPTPAGTRVAGSRSTTSSWQRRYLPSSAGSPSAGRVCRGGSAAVAPCLAGAPCSSSAHCCSSRSSCCRRSTGSRTSISRRTWRSTWSSSSWRRRCWPRRRRSSSCSRRCRSGFAVAPGARSPGYRGTLRLAHASAVWFVGLSSVVVLWFWHMPRAYDWARATRRRTTSSIPVSCHRSGILAGDPDQRHAPPQPPWRGGDPGADGHAGRVLAAIITLASTPLYRSYGSGSAAVADQALGG